MAIVARLTAARTTGPLFVNAKGTPWTGFSIRCRFQRLHNSGKVGKRYFHYAMRHSFGSYHYAKDGNSIETARILGHKSDDTVLFSLYRALTTKEQGVAYFAIFPKHKGRVIAFPLTAKA